MNNLPSPYPEANYSGPPGQIQGTEMLYGYPHTADFPQPNYSPMQPPYGQAQAPYADAQLSGYTSNAKVLPPGSSFIRAGLNGLLIVLTTLMLLLLVAGGSFYYYIQVRSTPEKTLQVYCSALKNGDSQALYNTYSSDAQAQTDEVHIQQALRMIEFLSGGIDNCVVDKHSIYENGSQASARITCTSYSGNVKSALLELIDEKGQWRIERSPISP